MSKDDIVQVITAKNPYGKFFKAYAVRCSEDGRQIVLRSEPCENVQSAVASLHTRSCEAVHNYISTNGFANPRDPKTALLEAINDLWEDDDDETASIISGRSGSSTAAFSEWNDSGDETGTSNTAEGGEKRRSAARLSMDTPTVTNASTAGNTDSCTHERSIPTFPAHPTPRTSRSRTAAASGNGLNHLVPSTCSRSPFRAYGQGLPPPTAPPLPGQLPSLPSGLPGPSGPLLPPPGMRVIHHGPPMPPHPFAGMNPYRPQSMVQVHQQQQQGQGQPQQPPFVYLRGPHPSGLQMPRGTGEGVFKPVGPPSITINGNGNGNGNGNNSSDNNSSVDGNGNTGGGGSSKTNNGTNANTGRNHSHDNNLNGNPPPRPLSLYPHAHAYPRSPQQTHAVRITVNWLRHGQHRIVAQCYPTRESLQSAALTDVRLNPGAFQQNDSSNNNTKASSNHNNGNSNNNGNNNNNNNNNRNGNSNSNRISEPRPPPPPAAALRVQVQQAVFGGEAYDLRTFIGQDLTRLFHYMAVDDLPSFEVVVEDIGEVEVDDEEGDYDNDHDHDHDHDHDDDRGRNRNHRERGAVRGSRSSEGLKEVWD